MKIKAGFDRLRSVVAKRASAFGRKVGNVITAPLRAEAKFRDTVRQNDPAYQRNQKQQYLNGYDKYQRGEIDEYGNPK